MLTASEAKARHQGMPPHDHLEQELNHIMREFRSYLVSTYTPELSQEINDRIWQNTLNDIKISDNSNSNVPDYEKYERIYKRYASYAPFTIGCV